MDVDNDPNGPPQRASALRSARTHVLTCASVYACVYACVVECGVQLTRVPVFLRNINLATEAEPADSQEEWK